MAPFSRDEVEEIAGWVKSPTLGKIVKQIEDKYTAAWRVAQSTDDREFAWRMIKCLHQVVGELQSITDADRIEQHNATRKNFSFNSVTAKAAPRDL
jgi:hypothetical protein